LTENKVFVVELIKLVFGDRKLAHIWCLEKEFSRFHLEYSFSTLLTATSNQEPNWLYILCDFIA